MESKWSHALVAIVAVAVTIIVYTVAEAISDTAKALTAPPPRAAVVEHAAPAPDREARRDRDPGRDPAHDVGRDGARDGRSAERPHKAEPGADAVAQAGGLPADEEKGPRATRVLERAAELGVDPREVREHRASREGLTADQVKLRREKREDWRADQPPEALQARTADRHDRKAELTPEELEALDAQREARRLLSEEDPTLQDAAQVLKQLREAGEAFEEEEP